MAPLEKLVAATAEQCSEGNWNYDLYMFGMANGMIRALAIMRDEEPVYLDRPDKWYSDLVPPISPRS